ncbi:MAG: helicase-related protein [Actinomycetota bacterium]
MTERLIDAAEVLGDLKDFQRRTAEWVFHRMFLADDPSYRYLVADEVGLGKTHVAKGVIAQVIDHLQDIGDRRHDIVYVCSNGAIARQNLRKLVPRGIKPLESVERLTMLPLANLDTAVAGESSINLLAITPGTSLEFGSSTGRFEERVLAYAFLRELWGAPSFPERARWIFWHGVDPERGDDRLRSTAKDYCRRIRQHVAAFAEELGHIDTARRHHHQPSLRQTFDELVDGLAWKREFPTELGEQRRAFIGDVRRAMATVGIGLLDPDLVVLDEFQRFKDLLDSDGQTWAAQLANRLFTHQSHETGRPTRTLMLSATPYRMYSLSDEVGDDHYADFVATCAFLLGDADRVRGLQQRFRALRTALTDPAGMSSAGEICRAIEAELRMVMSRTERLGSTSDRGGMLTEPPVTLTVEESDLRSYVRLGDLAEAVDHHEPGEYWKSSPYLFNFMEAYQLKRAFETALELGDLPPNDRLAPGPGLLDWDDVDQYRRIDPQNARLRWLLQDLDDHGAFDLLWVPPSLPYYSAGSAYERPESATLTKRLVFSGWAVVPKVVSTLVSHEAERRAFAHQRSQRYTADYSARGGRRLDFRLEGRRPAAMTAFLFVWPSPSLAELGDPRPTSSLIRSLDEVLDEARRSIDEALERIFVDSKSASGPVDQRWYWAAPLLLDRDRFRNVIDDWFGITGSETSWTIDDPTGGFLRHSQEAWDLLNDADEVEPLGRAPEDLAEVLAEVAVGGPAVCALRSMSAVTGLSRTSPEALANAARIAWGFRSLFNAPDVTALVERDNEHEGAPYWRQAIVHSCHGNLQSLLDEHLHVLRDWLGFLTVDSDEQRVSAARAIAEKLVEALGVRTSSYRVDVPHLDGARLSLQERRMRTRFAVPFGNQRLEGGGEARVEAVSSAFNSPFWPFVVTSTSVGQEGLDFHLWCHAVVHWNLPSNPVDLEQREGRVHRFKGHAVRRNLADALGAGVLGQGDGDIWDALFDTASEQRADSDSEMVPYWVFSDGPARIERWAPVPPFSRDAAALPKLRQSLAAYRLAIGQPRQEELLEYLGGVLNSVELAALVDELRIDLTPPLLPGRHEEGPKTRKDRGIPVDLTAVPDRPTDVATVAQGIGHERRDRVRKVLEVLVELGCSLEAPNALRTDYMNIKPPRSHGSRRIASLSLSSGRVEFQGDSYSFATRLGLAEHFDYLAAGDKAAISVDNDEGVAAALALGKECLKSRAARR